MFKILAHVTKATTTLDNKLIIEGIASSPVIDLEKERFSEEAVKRMSDAVNTGNIPIKVEHENKFYSEVGVRTESIMKGDKMYVKGELDLDFSFARDIQAMLNKGKSIALSV